MLGFGALGEFTLGQGWSDAAASGATLTETVSLIAGVATGTAAVGGQTISVTEIILSGTVTAAAGISGITLQEDISLISGTASIGDVSGNASGSIIEIGISLIPGIATSIIEAAGISSYYIPFIAKPKPRPVSKDAKAYGELLSLSIHFIAGQASGSAVASGSVIEGQFAFLPGKPAGWSYYPGRATGWSYYPGRATGNASVRGVALLVKGSSIDPNVTVLTEDEIDHITVDNDFLMVA